jgi:hypothetical protein
MPNWNASPELSNLPKEMFRLWQPHGDDYMLAWNGLVAIHTIDKLNEEARAQVLFKAGFVCAGNCIDAEKADQVPLANYLISLALAGESIYPILAWSPAKWFWLVDPFGANARLRAHLDKVMEHVIHDLWSKHGVHLQ